MRKVLAAAAVLSFVATAAMAGDPIGAYDIQGTDPGTGAPYSGTVTVTQTGQTYRIIWLIDGDRYVGTGIGNKEFLAVSYISGGKTGLALYAPNGEGWSGVWTYAGGTTMGTDAWVRKN